jgi:hypothetical protein
MAAFFGVIGVDTATETEKILQKTLKNSEKTID